MTDLSRAAWRKSSYSNIGGECVEVAADGGIVGVRDTRDQAGAVLAFSPAAWQRFAAQAKRTDNA
jgi:Domain of unknown function (DUF397)